MRTRPCKGDASPFAGVTLIELLVTISVVVIGMLIATGPLNDMWSRNATAIAGNTFLSAVKHARSVSVMEMSPVTVCGANEERSGCRTGYGSAVSWHTLLTFVDDDGDGVLDAEDRLLRIASPPSDIAYTRDVGRPITFAGDGQGGLSGDAREINVCKNARYQTVIYLSKTGNSAIRESTGGCIL